MPPLPSPGAVIRVDTQFAVGTDTNVDTRLFFSYTGGAPTNADCATLAAYIRTQAVSHLVPVLATPNLLENVTVTDLSSASGHSGIGTGSTAGTLGTDANPAGVAVLSLYHIARRYRGGKPRSYWPIGDQAALTNPSAWSGSAVSSFLGAITGYINAIDGHTSGALSVGTQVNVSYYSGFTSVQSPTTHRWRNIPTVRATPVVDNVQSVTVASKPGSQRRRYQR